MADGLSKYLLSEYENIAEAHFRTISAISAFFRYYLLIAGFPLTILGVLIGFSTTLDVKSIVSTFGLLISLTFGLVAVLGLLVLLYVINLRMDAILYARTVNGLRKYFYDESKLDLKAQLGIRGLPQSPSFPRYNEGRYFLPVVFTFGLLNSFYVFLALAIPRISSLASIPYSVLAQVTAIPIAFFLAHWGLYLWYARFREHEYLQSHAIGVDIDGVLNDHRTQFCRILKSTAGKTIRPQDITRIPVHEDPRLGITWQEESAVFDVAAYYAEMPSIRDVAQILNGLRNQFNLKVHVFTYRPRPSFGRDDQRYRQWVETAQEMLRRDHCQSSKLLMGLWLRGPYRALSILRLDLPWPLGLKPIDIITKCWLAQSGFVYDNLTIDRVADTARLVVARKRQFRFFVEDSPEQAAKLAYVCDIVFLLKQPYNRKQKLPNNVMRVNSWDEIQQNIRSIL